MKGIIIMLQKKLLGGVGAAVLTAGLAFGAAIPAQAATPAHVQAQSVQASRAAVQPAQITQTITDAAGNVLGTFTGTFTPTGFTSQNGTLNVNGLLNGTVTNAAGQVLATVTNQATSTSVVNAAGQNSCDILNLVLGPLHLDVLGLVVDLNQVHLDISAVPGAGNLLGNLLCSVAGLLDNGTGLNGLANILNHLLGL